MLHSQVVSHIDRKYPNAGPGQQEVASWGVTRTMLGSSKDHGGDCRGGAGQGFPNSNYQHLAQ